jgi:hypothetical protein
MYYSGGSYEAFARLRKPKGVEAKTAWLVGSGIASLAGAAFLMRDGHSRTLLAAAGRQRDGKEIDIPGPAFLRNLLMKKLDKTQIVAPLHEFKLVGGD